MLTHCMDKKISTCYLRLTQNSPKLWDVASCKAGAEQKMKFSSVTGVPRSQETGLGKKQKWASESIDARAISVISCL